MFSFIANTLASRGIIIATIVEDGSPVRETYTYKTDPKFAT